MGDSHASSRDIPAHSHTVVRSCRANGYLSRVPDVSSVAVDARSKAHYVRSVIELIVGSSDTAAMARIRNAVMRWILIEPQTIEHFRGTMPGYRDWLAVLDGDPIGVAVCARIAGMEESAAAFAVNCVLPEAREQGVGTAIYRQVSAHARSLGKSELELFGFADDLGGVRFAERHGFVVANRARGLRLVLDGRPRPPLDLPENVADDESRRATGACPGRLGVALEAMPDMPYDGRRSHESRLVRSVRTAPSRRSRDIPEATLIAVSQAEVVGLGQLGWMDRASGIAEHEMLAGASLLAGARAWQGPQGSPIIWGLDNGLSELRRERGAQRTRASRQRELPLHAAPRRAPLSRPTRSANVDQPVPRYVLRIFPAYLPT